jgi:hypothetical protein
MSGAAVVDEMIAILRGLATLPAEAAKAAAPLVDAAIKTTVRAGQDPDGKAWPLKRDGEPALVHAADHIATEARGTVIRATLTGVTTYHHFGATRGGVKRRVLPDPGTMPKGVEAALRAGAAAAFERLAG